jgi:hypothetical protein
MHLSHDRFQEIHVRLLNEAVEVWRPTEAVDIGSGLFQLFPTLDFDPTDESWEFLPGATVATDSTMTYEGTALVPVFAATGG